MKNAVEHVRSKLLALADNERRESSKRFFKETVDIYGIKSADVTKVAKAAFTGIKKLPKQDIFALCEELWQSGILEEGGVACIWSHSLKKHYTPDDFAVFERWVDRYIHNWASCDTLCNHTIGSFLEMYPAFSTDLAAWADSRNRWKKRASAVSFIVPARKGLFLRDIFAIAEKLLMDEDDLVQKGYGWMLKAASEAHRDLVYDFVLSRKERMPRTAYRYALEKMPKEMRDLAMKK